MTIFLMAPVVVIFYLPFFRRLNLTTAYEYLEKRFNIAVRLFGSAFKSSCLFTRSSLHANIGNFH